MLRLDLLLTQEILNKRSFKGDKKLFYFTIYPSHVEEMSMTRREVEEEEQAQMLMRAITGNNVKKIEAVLEKTKRHGKGFVLTSQYARPRPRKSSPKNTQKSAEPHLPMVVGSPIGSPSPTRKSTPLPEKLSPPPTRSKSAGRRQKRRAKSNRPSSQPTYLTEFQLKPTKVDMAVQSDDIDTIMKIPEPPPTTPEQRSESGELEANCLTREKQTSPLSDLKRKTSQEKLEPAKDLHSFTDMTREEPVGQENNDKRRKSKKKQNRIRDADFARLGLSKRPPQFKTKPKLPPSSIDKDPQNPEPMRPNIWVTRVPKEGGDVKTPFYLQVDIPDGALLGDVIMKFETQAYEKTKLSLSETDKLCSYVVDVNMNPTTYNLHQEATVRLRILEECINKHEDAYVVSARHFNWNRIPTEIEVKEVNGDRHFYAVAKTQYLGKFAVITSPRLDRFVMTSAGGTFPSTILPHVSINLEEGSVKDIAHIVEMSVAQSRQEAVTKTSLECQNITDVPGQLVASSPIVEVSKEIMGRSGLLPDGSTLPAKVRVNMPVTTALKTPGMSDNDSKNLWKKPTVKIMQRAKMAWGDEYGRKGSVLPGFWEDITAEQKLLLHPVSIQNGDAVGVSADVPGQFLVLVFDENSQKATGSSKELSEVCESLLLNNNTFNAVLMVHQRVAKPEIIS
ncbi:unnamed protein product [Clavelina lepadiformis]